MSVDFSAATADEARACYWALSFYQFDFTAGKRSTSPQDALVTGFLNQLQTRANALQLNSTVGGVGNFFPSDIK